MTLTPQGVAAAAATVAAAAEPAPVQASIDASLVRDRFNWDWCINQQDFTDAETYWWYASSIRLDPNEVLATDEEGNLWSVPFTTDGLTEVTFGAPVRGGLMFVPAAASDGVAASTVVGRRRQRVLASGLERPTKPDPNTPAAASADVPDNERNPMDPEVLQALARQHGLDPESATEDAVNAAVIAATAANLPGTAEETPTTDPAAEADVPVVEPVLVAASAAPAAGTVVVDEARLAALEQAEASRQAEDRDRIIATAIDEGRFAPSRRDHYETAWANDPDGTRTLLTASAADGGLAPNTVPVKERGSSAATTTDNGSLGRVLASIPTPRKAA